MQVANIRAGHVITAAHAITATTIMAVLGVIPTAVVTRIMGIIQAGHTRIGATERRVITRTRITAVIRTVVTTTTIRTTRQPTARTTGKPTAITDQQLQPCSSASVDSATTTGGSTELSDHRPAMLSRVFKAEMAWPWMGPLAHHCSKAWG